MVNFLQIASLALALFAMPAYGSGICDLILRQFAMPKAPVAALAQADLDLTKIIEKYADPQNIDDTVAEKLMRHAKLNLSKEKFVQFYQGEAELTRDSVRKELQSRELERIFAKWTSTEINRRAAEVLKQVIPHSANVEAPEERMIQTGIRRVILKTELTTLTEDEVILVAANMALYIPFFEKTTDLIRADKDGSAATGEKIRALRTEYDQAVSALKAFARLREGNHSEVLDFTYRAANGVQDVDFSIRFPHGEGSTPSCCMRDCGSCPYGWYYINQSTATSRPNVRNVRLPPAYDWLAPKEDELAKVRVKLRPILGDISDPRPSRVSPGSASFRRSWLWWFDPGSPRRNP